MEKITQDLDGSIQTYKVSITVITVRSIDRRDGLGSIGIYSNGSGVMGAFQARLDE
jgi:hypothetical protein